MRSARAPVTEGFSYPYDTAWRQVREPHAEVEQVMAFAAGAALCLATFVLWLLLAPLKPVSLGYTTVLVALLIVAVLHELVHAIAFSWPDGRRLRVELVWRRYVPKIRYDGAISRRHYIAMLVAPYLAISIAPIAVAMLLRLSSGDVMLISLLNALFSGADLVALSLVRNQVPTRATVRTQGDTLLWKPAR